MTTSNWRVRPAQSEDTQILTDIVVAATKAQGRWRQAAGDQEMAWRERFMSWTRRQALAADPTDCLSVIVVEDQPVGRLRVLRRSDQDIELAGVQLLPAVQGRGIGTAVVRELQAEATRVGKRLSISVEKDNPRARALYERLGCVKVGETTDEDVLQWTSDNGSRSSAS